MCDQTHLPGSFLTSLVSPVCQMADQKAPLKLDFTQPADGRKVRGWCFTFNIGVKLQELTEDGTDLKSGGEALEDAVRLIARDTAVQRCIFQLEAAPNTGMLHVQGYVYFQHARRLSTVRHWAGVVGFRGAHLEPQRGTPTQAWDYCQKAESRVLGPFVHGDPPSSQGQRQDLKAFVSDAAKLRTGALSLTDLQETHYGVEARHTRYFDRVVGRAQPARDFQTYCAVFYGDSGTGKSRYARSFCEQFRLGPYYLRLPETKTAQLFFERYASEPVVICDEMGPGKMQLGEFNSLIDCRPHLVNVKGASAPFLSRLIIFTSNFHPDEWFVSADGDDRLRQTVRRRINWLIEFTFHPDHRPDRTFSNAEEVWENAQRTIKKDDSLIEQWAEDHHANSRGGALP